MCTADMLYCSERAVNGLCGVQDVERDVGDPQALRGGHHIGPTGADARHRPLPAASTLLVTYFEVCSFA